jgi:hypothetical protein
MTFTKSPDKNFTWAVEQIEDSYKVSRESWGHNEFLELRFIVNDCYPVFIKTSIDCCGHKNMSPWFATFDDVVANDWGYV